MVLVLYTKTSPTLSSDWVTQNMKKLPEYKQLEVRNLHFLRDKRTHTACYLLLIEGLKQLGYDPQYVQLILKDKYGRPHFKDKPFFNLSHSNEYAICVISNTMPVGADIEEHVPVNIEDFTNCFNDSERKTISESTNFVKEFFTYWTIKEAAMKLDGRGFSLSPLKIEIEKPNNVVTDNNSYFYMEIPIDNKYTAHITAPRIITPKVKRVDHI